MKYLIGIVFLWVIFSACTEEIPELPESELKVNTESFVFEAAGGEQALIIASNLSWLIEHGSDWCTPSVDSGIGDVTLTLSVLPNESVEERSTTFILRAVDDLKIELLIVQKGLTEVVEEPVEEYTDMRDITSVELSQLMGLGWNLGNSMEAINASGSNFSGNETTWGNPRVSQRLIDSVKAAGFNAIRIPVSWSHQLEDQNSFLIKEAWLERVEEVVNYVLSNEMYAIINIHWDGGWMDHPVYAKQDEINTKIEALWWQIADHFANYNDYLLFAGTNEVHVENNWGSPSTENREVQNSFNQTFIDAVRSTGGRNAIRHLIVQGYVTNIDYTVRYFETPKDTAENRLMVEVHFYDPYDFALQESGGTTLWGKEFAGGDVSTWGQESWVDEAFGKMKKNFVDKGIPVILGEYGAILRSGLATGLEDHKAARNYYLEYTTAAALKNGMVPFYWDNGYGGNNGFGLFNRSNGTQLYPDAIQSIMKAKN